MTITREKIDLLYDVAGTKLFREEFYDTIQIWLRKAQAEALREFRQRLIGRQVNQYGIVLPDVNEIVDDIEHAAYYIEQNGEGSET